MESIIDRFLLIVEIEGITEISAARWHDIKKRKVMRTSELDAFNKVFPEYSIWLATGIEILQEGHTSPLTKRTCIEIVKK